MIWSWYCLLLSYKFGNLTSSSMLKASTRAAEAGKNNTRGRGSQCKPTLPVISSVAAATAAATMLLISPMPVDARLPPPRESAEARCTVEALDKFADTRAKFSMEASSGGMEEAFVDARGCDFKGLDLRSKVLSGVILQGADLSGANLSGVQMSRADARGANFAGANMDDVNGYGTQFDGANCEDVTFDNAILSNASFGKFEGNWAILKNTHFEGALLSSSDVIRVCENPTLLEDTRRYELGCRGSR